jgi:hypothetical protein
VKSERDRKRPGGKTEEDEVMEDSQAGLSGPIGSFTISGANRGKHVSLMPPS